MSDNVVPITTEVKWFDSFINLLAGLGVTGRDKMMSQTYTFTPLSMAECEMAYRGDWLVRKACQAPAWDMTREWRHWEADPEQITALETLERKLFLPQKMQRALLLSRIYGGAAVIIGVEGAGNPEEPLDPNFVFQDSLKWLHVVSRNNISIGPVIYDITSPWYGQPAYYEANTQPLSPQQAKQFGVPTVTPTGKQQWRVKLHPSRVVKLIGMDIGDTQIDLVWGDPILQAINDAIKACGLVSGSLATLISEMKIDIIKIPNLTNILSTDAGTRKVVGRFQAANAAKSVINTIMIDSNEEWTRIQQSLNGMDGLIATYLQIVSGAVDIPAGRFLGLPHRGLNVTGEADFRNYYDRLASEQNVTLTPAMNVLDEVIIRSALGDRPDNVRYEWNSLWQLSDDEKATVALKKAQAYQIDVASAQLPSVALANARANQLIEDGTYPGLEQALEEAAAEGDTIEEQNAPAPPPVLPPGGGVSPPQLPPPGPQPPPASTGGAPPALPAPAATGDSAFEDRRLAGLGPDSTLQDWINAAVEDYNECHSEQTGEFCSTGGGGGKKEAKKEAKKPAAKKKKSLGAGLGRGGEGQRGKKKEAAGAGGKAEGEAAKELAKKEKEVEKEVGKHEKEEAKHEKAEQKAEKQAERETAREEKQHAKAEKEQARGEEKAAKQEAAAAKKQEAAAKREAAAAQRQEKKQAAAEAKAHKQAAREEKKAQAKQEKGRAKQEKGRAKEGAKQGRAKEEKTPKTKVTVKTKAAKTKR